MNMLTPAQKDKAGRESRRLRLEADPTIVEHGRTTTYGRWGCRCELCREAWREYKREHRNGVRRGPRKPRPAVERFWKKVAKGEGCWGWVGAPTAKGYGRIATDDGTHVLAHRFAYELLVGPVPEGLQIDHTCYNRMCVNPAHLRAVDHTTNLQNRSGAQRSSKSGVRGVHQHRGKWRIQVTVEGKRHSAGPFATMEDAERAAVAMRRELMPASLRDR